MSMKNPLTPAGIEPATFRFVAQHLNHCATAVPAWLLLSSVLLCNELPSLLSSQFIRQLNNRNWGKIPMKLRISLNVWADFINSCFGSSWVWHCVVGWTVLDVWKGLVRRKHRELFAYHHGVTYQETLELQHHRCESFDCRSTLILVVGPFVITY